MPSNLLTTWAKLKAAADNADGAVLERIARAYAAGYVRLDPKIQTLTEQIDALQKAGKVTSAQIKASAAYKALMAAVASELEDYTAYLRTEITDAATVSAKVGVNSEVTLLMAALADSLGVEVKDVPKDSILRPNDKTLEFLAKYLDDEGALFGKIYNMSGYYAEEISAGILERVGQGMNPKVIAEWIADEYGYPLTDALRQMRTVQLYSYREAQAAVQVENADVLQGVVWDAELDDVVCMSCVALHGQVFPVGTVCDDHHNGRCAMIPWLKGEPNPIEQTGADWFSTQSESTQKSMMGDEKWQAWKDEKFTFDKLSTTYENDVFGTMRRESSLKELLGE